MKGRKYSEKEKEKFHQTKSLRYAVFVEAASVIDSHNITAPEMKSGILECCVSNVRNKFYHGILKKSEKEEITWLKALQTFKPMIKSEVLATVNFYVSNS